MKKSKSYLSSVFGFLKSVFAIIGLILVIYHLYFDISSIYSESMSPTLRGTPTTERDYVLTEKISYRFRKPRRWEIVKYMTKDEYPILVMKRIVGLEGETISIKDNWININGKPLERPAGLGFLKYYGVGELNKESEVKCAGGYFTLGDDSFDSYDSRFTGIIEADDIEGRAWMIIWPLSRVRLLTRLSESTN
jgi:signal peptidase I